MKTAIKVLLATASFVAVHTHQMEVDNPWECKHDHFEHEEPTFTEIEEEGLKDVREGKQRLLADYPQLRTYGYYGLLNSQSSSYRNYIENDLVPPLLSYFESALKVKYPVSGSLRISESALCSVSTPSVLRNGVQADYVYMVEIQNAGDQWVMNSSPCNLAAGSNRPLVGLTRINPTYIQATSDPLLHEKNMICLMHEMTHTLGFSSSLFKRFIDSYGNTLNNIVERGSLDGLSNQIINVEPLTTKLRNFFGCSNLRGAYMENTGSDATAGSHFERRQYAFEAMTSGLIVQMQYSQFTLAMLESSGWYVADYSYADPFFFGQGQGCNFLTGSCSPSAFPEEFCSGSGRSCDNVGRGGGVCSTDSKSDNCKWIHPESSYDCESPEASSFARLPDLQAFGRGSGAKCFEGTLNSRGAGSQTTFCFKHSCIGSGSNTVLNIEVGGKTVQCNARGSKTVAGYAGTIECPDPVQWCSTIGQKVCPRGCMGRGDCIGGVCSCYNGFRGEDCALNA